MTLIAVSIMVESAAALEISLARAAAAVAGGARMIEWRVDELAGAEGGADRVVDLVRRSPAPSIVTCRRVEEGGSYAGGEVARIELLDALTAAGTAGEGLRYVDVELAAFSRCAELREAISRLIAPGAGGTVGLILSSHDHEDRPADLLQRVESMAREPDAAVIKLAWRARSIRDNLEAFDLLAERRKPAIALCMGSFGLPSRVLAPKFGALLTYAAPEAAGATAPGQPTLETLRALRFDEIGAETSLYGVIGWPVGHSLSPALHNAGFAAVGHDAVYLPLPIPSEYEHFKATVGAMIDHPRLGFRGASVTVPHKEHLARFVAEAGGRADASVERSGAANTLIVGSSGAVSCVNTDGPAFVEALVAAMADTADALHGRRVAVLGAGGVARAVVAGLADAGASVLVCNRHRPRAETLVDDLARRAAARRGTVSVLEPVRLADERLDVLVNCTPVGMTGGPDPAGSPLPADVRIDETQTVCDTVYTPPRTPLIREAEARGARVVTGAEMFVRQAAMQFEMWTGRAAPMGVFREVLAPALTARTGSGPRPA